MAWSIKADSVFLGGKVYTSDPQNPWAEAVAIKNGEIIYVGSREGVRPYLNWGTERHLLNGKLLLPGFIDTHAHPVLAAATMNILAFNAVDDLAAIYEKLADYAAANPDLDFIMGQGFNAALFSQDPTSAMLDAVVADRPVFLMDDGGHLGWANSLALQTAGIDANTPDPVPGAHYYVRDAQGNPTGYMYEEATFEPFVYLNYDHAVAELKANSGELFSIMNSFGITSVFDASMEWLIEDGLQTMAGFEAQGKLPLRMVTSLAVDQSMPVADTIGMYEQLQQGFSSDRLNVGAIKIGLDGTLEGGSAALLNEYLHGGNGALNWDPQVFNDSLVALDKAGIDIHMHAIGDRAVNLALNAVASAREANGFHGTRHTICHTQLVQDSDIARFDALDVIAQTTPVWHANSPGLPWNQVDEQELEKLFPFNSLAATGARVTFGSDFPYGGGFEALVPAYNIEVGATRVWPHSQGIEPLPKASEKLDVATLVRGYTLDAAYQLRMEDKIGSIEVGKRADLIVLNKNIFEIPSDDIHNVKVKLTMVDGEVVYTRSFYQWLVEMSLGL